MAQKHVLHGSSILGRLHLVSASTSLADKHAQCQPSSSSCIRFSLTHTSMPPPPTAPDKQATYVGNTPLTLQRCFCSPAILLPATPTRPFTLSTSPTQLHASHGGPKHSSQSWQDFFSSPAWAFELKTSGIIAPGEQGGGFQIKATDAAAAALWACVAHWHSPRDVIVAAAHYGGDTDTIACMAGEGVC